MSLITTDIGQWALEKCSTKEDVQYYIDKLQEIKDNWIEENEENEEIHLKKYCVNVGYRYTIALNVLAEDEDKATELAADYVSTLPITDTRFVSCGGDYDAWEEDFDNNEVDLTQEVW